MYPTPPVIRLLNGGTLSMPSVVMRVAELWIGDTRQSDGLYTAANMPTGVHAPGGVLIVGGDHPFKVWTGGKSGLFSSGGNWSDGQPPTTGDLLVFNKTVNLESESTDIGADGMSLYVAQSCILTNNNVFTGSGLLTKLGKGRIREYVELESTGGFKVTDGIVELCVQGNALFKNATGTVELDYTGGTTPKLVGAPWSAVVKNHVKVTGNPPSNYNVVEQSNLMKLSGGIESGSDFVVCGYYGPLHISGGISAPGKTMKYIINGRHSSNKTSQLADTVDCSLVVSNYFTGAVAIMEMSGNSPNPANSFTMLGCTNRLTAAAYWGGTNIVVRRAETIIPAHLILNGENNLNPEATLTLADGGTVEVAAGKKVCIAHLVTDDLVRWTELPLAVQRLLKSGRFDAVLALGCVIQGATPHADLIEQQVARSLTQLGLQYDKPVTGGLVAAASLDQAIERAGTKMGNKGWDAAMAAIEMASVFKQL